jgi:hypothetical protein
MAKLREIQYTYFYYAMSTTTGEIKFVAHSKAYTNNPRGHRNHYDLSKLRRKFLGMGSNWRIIETGFAQTGSVEALKYKPLNPKSNDGSMAVYVSV